MLGPTSLAVQLRLDSVRCRHIALGHTRKPGRYPKWSSLVLLRRTWYCDDQSGRHGCAASKPRACWAHEAQPSTWYPPPCRFPLDRAHANWQVVLLGTRAVVGVVIVILPTANSKHLSSTELLGVATALTGFVVLIEIYGP